MTLVLGTTARHTDAIARWLLVILCAGASLAWWSPSYQVWAAWGGGLAVVLAIWLTGQMLLRGRYVPGHPIHWAWLAPAGVLTYHLARTGVGHATTAGVLAGAMEASFLLNLALAAAGVMLSQALFSRQVRNPLVICLLALTMTAGAVLETLAHKPLTGGAVALVGLAGFWAVVSAAWPGEPALPTRKARGAWFWSWRIGCLALASAGALILTKAYPREALLSLAGAGAAALAAATLRPGHRGRWLAVAAILGTVVAAALASSGGELPDQTRWPNLWLGLGEDALASVGPPDSGLTVLGQTTGAVGLIGLAGGMLYCLLALWLGGDPAHPATDKVRGAAWTTATLTVCAAVLVPGGLFVPAALPAAGLILGLLPAVLGCRPVRRPALLLVVVVGGLLLLTGLSGRNGLMSWAAAAVGGGNPSLHVLTGFLMTLMLVWWLGARTWYWGAGVIIVSAALGGVAELAQERFSARGGEWADWGMHLLGTAPAAILYVLSRLAPLCELPDGRTRRPAPPSRTWVSSTTLPDKES